MSDPSLAILAALIETLRSAPQIAVAFDERPVAIWQTVPHGAADPGSDAYPFVRIAELQVVSEERIETPIELETGSDDVMIDDPSEVFATIHGFSRPRQEAELSGMPEALRIMKAVRAALGRPEDIVLEVDEDGDAFALVLCEIRDTRHFVDPDGITAHSVMTARFEVQPTEG